MSRPRIAVAGFQHETNTFSPVPTRYEDFEASGAWPALTKETDIFAVFHGLNIPLGGFIDAARDEWDLVPILWSNAEPGGYVAQDAFDRIAAMICDGIAEAGALDGIYLDLHGAMVTDDFEDGEGELLRRLRDVVGPDLPIAVSLDLHGNLTREFVELASVLAIYRTYPHVDMAATGARAKLLLAQLLASGQPFAKAFRQLDYLIPLQAQSTMREPGERLYGLLPGLEGSAVACIDLAFGFPPADIHHCGSSVVAFGTEQAAVDHAADEMLKALQESESEFHNPLIPANAAVRQAMEIAATAGKPVILADPQDNPGAGAIGDTTGLLKALVQEGAKQACLGMLWDPETASKAHEAGVGSSFTASIGNCVPQPNCGALDVQVRVEALSDGKFLFTGPMYGGTHADLGSMAVLLILDDNSEVRVVVGSHRAQNADQAIFRHIGIDPTQQKLVAVKSAVHFLADYQPIAEEVVFAEAPGANPCQLDLIPFKRLRPDVRLGPNGPVYSSAAE
ncbi:M81 family metallopeptidase [Pelagibius sp. Alg239-R121]|uniref:M81 family metallopeptidase n=1 Tax=Pelagibius sp. Alg239-R121 TaxID=2993448 RepID=UPI0024A718F1|nr:M81 family metallopeptidase [Pelagibius sp. Alg239-R121]